MMHKYSACRGITMIEATIATLLVGIVFASTLGVIGPVMRSTELAEKQIVAQRLVDELVSEIMAMPFDDPEEIDKLDMRGGTLDLNTVDALDPIGTNDGERSIVREDFDDVDDYEGWSSIPPSTKSGNKYIGMANWERQVRVHHVEIEGVDTKSLQRTGAKWIRIRAIYNGILLAEEIIIRSESWDSMRSEL